MGVNWASGTSNKSNAYCCSRSSSNFKPVNCLPAYIHLVYYLLFMNHSLTNIMEFVSNIDCQWWYVPSSPKRAQFATFSIRCTPMVGKPLHLCSSVLPGCLIVRDFVHRFRNVITRLQLFTPRQWWAKQPCGSIGQGRASRALFLSSSQLRKYVRPAKPRLP